MHIFTTVKVNLLTLILGMSFALMIGYAIGYFLRRMFTEYQIKEAEERRKKIVDEAEQEVSRKLRSAEIEAREKSLLLKSELEKEKVNFTSVSKILTIIVILTTIGFLYYMMN